MQFTQQPDGTLVGSPFFVGTRPVPTLCGDKEPPEEHDWQFETPLVEMVLTDDIAQDKTLVGRKLQHQTCKKCKYTRVVIPPK